MNSHSWMLTPIGIGLIGIYSALVGVVILWPLSRLLRNCRWKRWLVSIVGLPLLAAPWAEEVWIAWHFKEACKDAGVKVVRQVEVDGFYDSTMRSGYALVRDNVYLFMEHPSNESGKVDRVERIDGEWRKTVLDRPQARYHYKFLDPRREIPIGRRLKKFGDQVIDSETNEVLGSDTRFVRYPSLTDSLWLQYFGPSALSCNGPLDAPEKQKRTGAIYDYVLKSKKSH